MVSSHPLTAARDQAFSKYGEIAHLNVGAARCSVSVNSHITDNENRPLGLIGGFESIQDQATFNELLHMGYEWLRKHQCRQLRGPIVRHTWYSFRAVVEGFDNGPQLTGEPWNSPLLPELLRQGGFV
ncbi:MAG TPA: hypothetical protein EYN66_24210, partial [Myxococcales bacterium]|nr:hypothetical protein [Myxococcales bacterium]